MVHKIGIFLAILAFIDGTLGGGPGKTSYSKYMELLKSALVRTNAVIVPETITNVVAIKQPRPNYVNLDVKFNGHPKNHLNSGVKWHCHMNFVVESMEKVVEIKGSGCGSVIPL
ncbi:hypothetical protein GE061_007874 [Apolygus lucorum]|uniref:Uncharacterized protein n=1 Tax=Apolygus lucorum TaxID=248454 RepID=A0A8S9WN53_APOLU|nr:hypothetical protein GE061_007874 [Apolygus lucorum]